MTNSHDNLLKIMIKWSFKMLVLIIVRNVDVMQRWPCHATTSCPNMPCYLIIGFTTHRGTPVHFFPSSTKKCLDFRFPISPPPPPPPSLKHCERSRKLTGKKTNNTNYFPTYLPGFFSGRYPKQTIFIVWPHHLATSRPHHHYQSVASTMSHMEALQIYKHPILPLLHLLHKHTNRSSIYPWSF